MTARHTHAIEDYLKTIYELGLDIEQVTTNQIAERLNVTPASVTGMLKRLASNDPPLVAYRKHYGVTLTPAGKRVALETLRHHRLIELFLHETLGYSWDEVHEEADRLEHVISEEFEERIAAVLGHPLVDPHGDPIPSRELRLPKQSSTCLIELEAGQRAVVQRVTDEDPALLRYLSSIGLVPQASLEVLERLPFDDNLRLQLGDQEVVLGPRITNLVLVEVI